MASFKDEEKVAPTPSLSSPPLFTLVDWDDGHQPGGIKEGQKNPTRMAVNHDKAGVVNNNISENRV